MDREIQIQYDLTYMWILEKPNLEMKSRMLVTRVCVLRGGEGWGDVGQMVETLSYRKISSGNLKYSMMTTVNNTILYS